MGGEGEDPQKLKRIAAAAYDYDNDPRWADYWSNVLIPPQMASRDDVVDHFKRKFYQRYIDPDLNVESMAASGASQPPRASATQSSSSSIPNSNTRQWSPGSSSRTSGTSTAPPRNSASLRWDRQTIQFSVNAWAFVVAVLAMFPIIPKSLSNRAYRLSFLGTAFSSVSSLYSLYGKPRAWNLQALQVWFQSVVATKDFIYSVYCLIFVSSNLCLKFALIPILCRALEHAAKFLRRNFGRSSLYRVCKVFHFIAATSTNISDIRRTISSSFPYLAFRIYPFDDYAAAGLISNAIREALDSPLNYARNYLANLLPLCVQKIVYLDSDVVLVDDIGKLVATQLTNDAVLAAPEYCNANFTSYFTPTFWSNPSLSLTFANRKPCYFNTGVMVIDLERWRAGDHTTKIVEWMELQKRIRIYELGSLPPFSLVFAGNIAPVDHRWNQHGLGGDNFLGLCRDLHPGPVSLLHWSGKGKPWARLDAGRPCPLDALWAPYDLLRSPCFLES